MPDVFPVTTFLRRSISEPIRENLSWEELWKREDNGLIYCWERGRKLQEEQPELATRARKGELVMLWWRGGVEEKIQGEKVGTFAYLATWQGLRGEDLTIDMLSSPILLCSRTNQKVTYRSESVKE